VNLENVAAGGFQIMHAQGEVESEDENYSEGDDKVRSVEHRGLPIRGLSFKAKNTKVMSPWL